VQFELILLFDRGSVTGKLGFANDDKQQLPTREALAVQFGPLFAIRLLVLLTSLSKQAAPDLEH
jgi:hypothetical protein